MYLPTCVPREDSGQPVHPRSFSIVYTSRPEQALCPHLCFTDGLVRGLFVALGDSWMKG